MTTEPNTDVERVAAAMWRAETIDTGTPESVTLRRTPEAFASADETTRNKWIKYARAAIASMPDREITVQEAAQVLADDVGFIIDLGIWLDKNGGKRWGQVWASHMVKLGLRAIAGTAP